jgi:hypothetical protein
MLKRLKLRLRCWWYYICFKHTEEHKHINGYLQCEKCLHERVRRKYGLDPKKVQRTEQLIEEVKHFKVYGR